MIRRARLIAVLAIVLAGAVGIIASTQTWLDATLVGGTGHVLAVPGAAAVPVLAPLSLAALALGLALSIVGVVLRYVFGALAIAIGGILLALTWPIAVAPPVAAVAAAVTEATGLSGTAAVASLVESITSTPWPAVSLAAWILLVGGGVLTLASAPSWARSGRRYRTDADGAPPRAASADGSRPHDAIDSWDDLSRGADPTA